MNQKFSKFDILYSTDCNLRCEHCCIKHRMTGNEVDTDSIIDTINKYRINDKIDIHISGEPSQNFDFTELYMNIKNADFHYTSNLCYSHFKSWYNIYSTMKLLKYDTPEENFDKVFISTSFDTGNIRFKGIRNLINWYRNLKYLKSLGEKVHVFVLITGYLFKRKEKEYNEFFHKLRVTYSYIPMINNDRIDTNDNYINWLETCAGKGNKRGWKSLSSYFFLYWLYEGMKECKYPEINKTYENIYNLNFNNCLYTNQVMCIDEFGNPTYCFYSDEAKCADRYGSLSVSEFCKTCNCNSVCGTRCVMIQNCYLNNKNLVMKVRKRYEEIFKS